MALTQDQLDDILRSYNCSQGTAFIVHAFEEMRTSMQRKVFDTININLSTLIRNNWLPDTHEKDVIAGAKRDLNRLITKIHEYWDSLSTAAADVPHIVAFFHTYGTHQVHTRALNPSKKAVINITEKWERETLHGKDHIIEGFGKAKVIFCKSKGYGTSAALFTNNIKLAEESNTKLKPRNRNHALITHVPIDYHLFFRFQSVSLIESYTGAIKSTQKEIAERVFGVDYVPFYLCTHLLFGDQLYISPLVMRNKKKEALEVAKKDRWMQRSEQSVIESIVHNLNIPRAMLTAFKL